MNGIAARIFGDKSADPQKLSDYGFKINNGVYRYETHIAEGQFALTVEISSAGVSTVVTDIAAGEEYTLHLVESAEGSFVGAVRAEYVRTLTDICEKCFNGYTFKQNLTRETLEYVKNTYGTSPEFLWDTYPQNAVLRRGDTGKWYGALLTVKAVKLGLEREGEVEVLDVRMKPEEIASAVDGKTLFGGYHMNKKHWVSVLLDGSAEMEKIKELLDGSYALAVKGKK